MKLLTVEFFSCTPPSWAKISPSAP